jgi:23S rRNA-/tRNA-specific pseudouridylate synthase
MAASAPDDPSSINMEVVTETLRTHYRSWEIHEPQSTVSSLIPFLLHHLPHIAPDSWPERFAFGGVYINGHEALGDCVLPIPCKVEYYEPKFEIARAQSVFPDFKEDYLVYNDEHIVAVYKPPGLSSMPAKEQRHFSVKAAVERLTGSTVHMPSRLDVSAQGLIIMSRSALAHAQLQQAFERRAVVKEYRCASAAQCNWDLKEVVLPIGRDPAHPVLRRVDRERGKDAFTRFTSLGRTLSGEIPVHVFCALPTTGRTHQIRVHAASCGIPLLGDRFYGGAPAPYLHLVSYAAAFEHPVTREKVRLELPEHLIPDWVAVDRRGV